MEDLEHNEPRGEHYAAGYAYGGAFASPFLSVGGSARARKVRRAIREGLKRRAEVEDNYQTFAADGGEQVELVAVIEPVGGIVEKRREKEYLYPRRRDPEGSDSHVRPPMIPKVDLRVSAFQTSRRLVLYMAAALRWYWRIFKDVLRRRDTTERRAKHLRNIIEELGGTAIKLGQQAALRMDLLPYEYCAELEDMLDSVKPFPTRLAVERVEALTGRPLRQTFAEFNYEPIGSGSVACIYEAALLQSGQRVAVKVRRPGIREIFLADCRALEWVLKTLEFFTILRNGYSAPLISGLRTILVEETDFIKEARHTELWRRRAHKRLSNISAPKIHFHLSGEDVLVQDFVNGIKMGDLIAFVQQKDEAVLEHLRRLDIDPKKIARKLIRVNQFGVFENLLFHADPHPSNLIVQPHNTIVFIDFGAVGAYTTMERNNWRQLNYYHQRKDVGRMAQTALAILEPLPSIDLDEFRQELEQIFWQDIYAHESKHSEWYEHTSVNIWRSLFDISYKFNVPMNLNTLRMIRSTLLSETVAARLYPGVSAWREHQKYNRRAARRSRRRVLRGIAKRICGPTDTDYQRIEQLKGIVNRTIYLYQRFIDTPLYRYQLLIRKVAYAFILIVKTVLNFLMLATLGLIIFIVADIVEKRNEGLKNNRPLTITSYMSEPFIERNARLLFAIEPTPTPTPGGPQPAQALGAQAPSRSSSAHAQGEGKPAPGASDWLKFLPIRLIFIIALANVLLNMRRMLIRFRDKDIRRRNTSGLS